MSTSIKEVEDQQSTENNTAEVVIFPGGKVDTSAHVAKLKSDAKEKAGKGLKVIGEGRSDITRVNPYTIKVKPNFNCRDFTAQENIDHVESLALQILADGVKTPLTVFSEDGNIYLEDGECRLRATIIAIEKHGAPILNIPVRTGDVRANEADRIFAQYRQNNTGKPFTQLETAENFKRAISYGYDEETIAKKIGKPKAWVKSVLDFDQKTNTEIKDMLREGVVSTGLVNQVMANSDSQSEATKILKTAVKKAAKKGKVKATAKDVGGEVGAKLNFKKTMVGIFENATVKRVGDKMVLTMSSEDYNFITDMLGIGM
jgi:ParB-like chromosome segregation protein Spo0J